MELVISVQFLPLSSLSCHWNPTTETAVPEVVNVSDLPSEDTTLEGFVIEVSGPPASWKSYTPLSSLSYSSLSPYSCPETSTRPIPGIIAGSPVPGLPSPSGSS